MAIPIAFSSPLIHAQSLRLFEYSGTSHIDPALVAPSIGLNEPSIGADMDGDGDLDIVSPLRGHIDINDGSGRFQRRRQILPVNGSVVRAPIAADFDGNGLLDLFYPSQTPRLVLQSAPMSFTAAAPSVFPAAGLVARLSQMVAVAGDVDADGDVDIVINTNNALLPIVWKNDGGGTFTSFAVPAPTAPPVAAPFDLVLLDTDGDGDLDAVTSTQSAAGAGVFVLQNDGTGTFTRGQQIETGTFFVDVANLDGFGGMDLVLASALPASARLFYNQGGNFTPSGFASSPIVPAGGSGPMGVAPVDANGDGRQDLMFGAEALAIVNPLGLGVAAPSSALPGSEVRDLHPFVGDFNADGVEDVLFDGAYLLLGNGEGQFRAASSGTHLEDAGTARAYADFDGDARVDAFSEAGVFFNTGDGRLERSGRVVGWQDGLAEDFDDDGDVDLLVWSPVAGPSQTRMLLNDGAGRFADGTSWAIPALASRSILGASAGDVDNDGDLDLVWVEAQSFRLHVTTNLGRARFGAGDVVGSGGRSSRIALADFDGDGLLDIYVGPTFLWMNRNGLFTNEAATRILGAQSTGVEPLAADFDGDGDADILCAITVPSPNGLRTVTAVGINDGTGVMTARAAAGLDVPLLLRESQVIDVDGDRDLDVVGIDRADLGALINDGSANFTVLQRANASAGEFGPSEGVRLADLDDDSDADFMSRGLIVESLGRQLRAPLVARRGAPFDIEYHSRVVRSAATAVAAFVGPVERRLEFAPFGVLWLDLGFAIPLPAASLDAAAEVVTAASFTMPSDPSLVDAAFFAQALTLDFSSGEIRLTNVLRRRIY